MSQHTFRGLYPILHTPFSSDGDVDFDSLRRLVRHVADAKVEGIVFPGFASEWWRLSDAEILECATLVAAERRVDIVLNVTAQATRPALRQAAEFHRIGATALMLLPPFVVPAPAEAHLDALLSAAELPCIVQDSAGLTGTTLDPASMARLRTAHPNLNGLKIDQVPTGPSITRYRANPELNGLSYFVGYSGVQMLDAARRGAHALMGGCGHLHEDRVMLDALLGPDAEAGYRAFARLSPLLNFEMQTLDMVIEVHKTLLYEAGIIATPLSRKPCRTMDDTHRAELKLHLAGLA